MDLTAFHPLQQLPKQVILSHSGALCQPLVEKEVPQSPSIQKQETKSSLSQGENTGTGIRVKPNSSSLNKLSWKYASIHTHNYQSAFCFTTMCTIDIQEP